MSSRFFFTIKHGDFTDQNGGPSHRDIIGLTHPQVGNRHGIKQPGEINWREWLSKRKKSYGTWETQYYPVRSLLREIHSAIPISHV
jgi:hypothetical protein